MQRTPEKQKFRAQLAIVFDCQIPMTADEVKALLDSVLHPVGGQVVCTVVEFVTEVVDYNGKD